MKESTLILFQMKDLVKNITLEPNGVADLHFRSQERSPVSEGFLMNVQINFLTLLDREEC